MVKYVLSAFADEAGESLEEQIAALQRNNIHYMEIRSVDGVNICKTPLETVTEYKKQLDQAGIKVLTIGSCIGKVSLKESAKEHMAMFLHTLGVAKILEAERIRMFSIFTKDGDPDQLKDPIFARLDELLGIAKAAGIELYHENEKGIYGDTERRVLDLMNTFGDRMGFIFDPANFIQCGCKPLEIYPLLKDRIGYFHIKDALQSGTVVPAGSGAGSIAEILKDFAKDHENVMLTVEPHLKKFQGIQDDVSINDAAPFVFKDNNDSFDAAVNALKNILEKEGLSYE